MVKRVFFIASLLSVLLFTACQNDSPEATAQDFLNSFYQMDFDKAIALSTPQQAELVKQIEQFSVTVSDSERVARKQVKVDIINVQQDGDNAIVTYTNSLEPSEQTLRLIHEGDKWLANNSKEDIIEGLDDDEVQVENVEEE